MMLGAYKMGMITGFNLNQKGTKEDYSKFNSNDLKDSFKNIIFCAKNAKNEIITLNSNELDKFIKNAGLNAAEVKAFLADLKKNNIPTKEKIVIDLSDKDYKL